MKGKLIVIEGIDGSGKATQAALLAKRLKGMGLAVTTEDFPQYGQKSAGLVEEYLNGSYGTAQELGPYIPSVFYAVDRFAAKRRILDDLARGRVVISNRYATTNMGHQGGKIRDAKERKKFYSWLQDFEYNFFGIPKPDAVVILSVPPETAQKLVDKKGHRKYIAGKKRDIHEDDISHLENAARAYAEMSRMFRFPLIECVENGKMLTPEKISLLVWNQIKKVL